MKMQKGRKKKVRFLQKMPPVTQFSPRGKVGRPDEVELLIDHFEALKLADFQGYSQFESAQLMNVSRPTFGRILREARRLVSDAIVNGKVIRIRIGNVQVGVRQKDLPKKSDVIVSQKAEEFIRNHIIKTSREITKQNSKKV